MNDETMSLSFTDKLRTTHQQRQGKRRSKWSLMKNVARFSSHMAKVARSNRKDSPRIDEIATQGSAANRLSRSGQ